MLQSSQIAQTAVFPVRCLIVWTVTGNVNCVSISALVSCEVCVCVCVCAHIDMVTNECPLVCVRLIFPI